MADRKIALLLFALMVTSLSACGSKKSNVGSTKKQPAPMELPLPSGTPSPTEVIPGGLAEGPTPVGSSGAEGDSGRDWSRGDSISTSDRGNLPIEGADSNEITVADITPEREQGDELSSEPVSGGLGKSLVPRRRPHREARQPWYPPNLDGTPAGAWLTNKIAPHMRFLENEGPAPRSTGRLKMTLALGYFDGYEEAPFSYNAANFGRHAALDPFLRAAVDALLTRPCRGRLQLCDFRVLKVDFIETVYRKNSRDGSVQDLSVISGAVTERHDLNTGARAEEQRERSAAADRIFQRSFQDSDLVVYVGHSRDGGGPDFSVPRLNSSNKVDYESYQASRPGLTKLLKALRQGAVKSRALAVLSCDSDRFFRSSISQAAPQMNLWTVKGQLLSEDLMNNGLLALEIFLRQGDLISQSL